MKNIVKSSHSPPNGAEPVPTRQDAMTSNPSCPAHVAIYPTFQPTQLNLVETIFPKAEILSAEARPSIVQLTDEKLMSISEGHTSISKDEGKTWTKPKAIGTGSGPGKVQGGVAVRTKDGAIVLVYQDLENMKNVRWNVFSDPKEEASDVGEAKLDVWAIRSLDQGQTWIDKQMIFQGYCGALIDMIQTATGRIIVPVQRLVADPIRIVNCTYFSDDEGKTWQKSNTIDLGGHGKHDGAFEATLEELKNGRLMMLIRTSLDRFWEAYSDDLGSTWREIRPSCLDSSNSPGYLTRLASGRLLLVWNRLFPEGEYSYPRPVAGGNLLSEFASSWQREELSIAFSEDDGKSWSKPGVILKGQSGSWFSYPTAMEPKPGVIWIFTCHKEKLGLSMRETDLLMDLN